MRMTTLFGRTLRQSPSEIDHPTLRLMVRAGLVRLSSGALTLLPVGTRALRRIEMIVRDELTRIGSQEVYLPLFRSGAPSDPLFSSLASASSILHCTDQFGRSLSIPPTDEAWIASLAATEIASYRQLPVLLYQVHHGCERVLLQLSMHSTAATQMFRSRVYWCARRSPACLNVSMCRLHR
jgi:prolyl-tRNA synthetase